MADFRICNIYFVSVYFSDVVWLDVQGPVVCKLTFPVAPVNGCRPTALTHWTVVTLVENAKLKLVVQNKGN